MVFRIAIIVLVLASLAPQAPLRAQELSVATVTRPPFSMPTEDGGDTGFSIELWQALAANLDREFRFVRTESFGDMLDAVREGRADAAIANISITASREEVMDFSQPIFESGLQIMVPGGSQKTVSMLRALFSWELMGAILAAFALLLVGGMFMWWFERRAQEYFDRPAKEAMFPAFWWALNLVVNGGFEERVPRTAIGRIFAVFLVISSLFIVSVFVARITAVMTVDAIQSAVSSVADLEGREVATIDGSTAAAFLDGRGLAYRAYNSLEPMLEDFENGAIHAIVFDAPVLSYYAVNSRGRAQMAGAVFQRENYGIIFPSGSPLAEAVNQSLLTLRENGTYAAIYRKWFGRLPGD